MAYGILHGQQKGVQTVNSQTPDASGNVNVTPSSINAVPTNRTVNGRQLSNNISLTASDVGALSSEYGGIVQGNINMNYNKITNINTPTNGYDAANKNYVDDKSFTKKNLSVSTGSWNTYSPSGGEETKLNNAGYNYRTFVSVYGLTSAYIPYITLSVPDVINSGAEVANMFLASSGGFYMYATSKPNNAINIPTAEFRKENDV